MRYQFAASIGLSLLLLLGVACGQTEQQAAVEQFNEESELVQVACLDINGDGRVNSGDTEPAQLRDLTGDGEIRELALAVLSDVDIALPDGKPEGCSDGAGLMDWQVTTSATIDCSSASDAILLFGVGGGAVDLNDLDSAAGVRWMLLTVGETLAERNVPYELASVAPGIDGAENVHAAAEVWATAFLRDQLDRHPCLHLVMLGHSHGGATVTAIASNLEAEGYADRLLITFLIDRVTVLYTGNADALPQQARVVNFYLSSSTDDDDLTGTAIDQANFENVDVKDAVAPEEGQSGGELAPVNHSTVDNSPTVLQLLLSRLDQAFAAATR